MSLKITSSQPPIIAYLARYCKNSKANPERYEHSSKYSLIYFNRIFCYQDVILLACELQGELDHNRKKLKDLEDYLDELLLRVMETTPRILQNPYINCKLTHQKLA